MASNVFVPKSAKFIIRILFRLDNIKTFCFDVLIDLKKLLTKGTKLRDSP